MTTRPHRGAPQARAADTDAFFARAVRLFNAGQAADAVPLCEQVVSLQPGHADAWRLLAIALLVTERPADALPALQRALTLQPRHTQLLCLLGTAHARCGQAQHAIASFHQALALAPQDANIWYDLGNVQLGFSQWAAALASYERALALAPQHADAWLNRAHALLGLGPGRRAEAIASLERAVDLRPRASTWLLLGQTLQQALRLPDALACCEKAVALEPRNAEGWLQFGTVLELLGRADLALQRLETAAQLAPDSAPVLLRLASVLAATRGDAAALAPLRRAHALAPDDAQITAELLYVMLKTVAWDGLPAVLEDSRALWDSASGGGNAMVLLAHPHAQARDLLAANRANQAACNELTARAPARPLTAPAARRLRLGYLSSDLRHHAVAFLMAGVLEAHDRAQFEVFAFSTYPQPDDSPERRRVLAAVEHFIDIHALGDDDAAALIAGHRIDVLVDLNGLTAHSRPGILARRPAPLQVQYLGYPGTSGLAAIDYIIGDRWVTPAEQADAFSEHIVRLPESFQANDDQRRIAPDTPTRAALGLPAQGFVFCCLNNAYKILPAQFDIWMRFLTQTPGSVLWLLGESQAARDHFRAHAQARGVAPERLVFAERRPYAEYLAQYRQADLFLDTLPFNGGTTVSDALWAGLPVLTQAGNRFAGRMAASLLDNLGLPELITQTPAEYEALGLRLASEPALLQGLRDRLAAQRCRAPLFDTRRFTRHLESAYRQMVERHARALPPAAFDVAALPR